VTGDDVLPAKAVQVWRVALDWRPAPVQALYEILSRDEQQRADRFHFAADRLRHVVGRGVLRTILARCTGIDAAQLSFAYGPFGKPRLSPCATERPLQFNVSHSGDLVLIALTLGRALGVDVECVRTDIAAEQIAASFFSTPEQEALASVPEHLRVGAFFDCWTRKEAYIKAVGDGLALPLHQFDVSLKPGEQPRLLATRPDPLEARRWSIQALDVGPLYRAAIAVEGDGWELRMRDWSSAEAG
jgi:4'-phosphopantetheinyl transferase